MNKTMKRLVDYELCHKCMWSSIIDLSDSYINSIQYRVSADDIGYVDIVSYNQLDDIYMYVHLDDVDDVHGTYIRHYQYDADDDGYVNMIDGELLDIKKVSE